MSPPGNDDGRPWAGTGTHIVTAPTDKITDPADIWPLAIQYERQAAAERVIIAYAESGQAMLRLARLGQLPPRHSELVQQREHSVTTRCSSPGCKGCSRCVRAYSIERNRRTYGQDDYPGTGLLGRAVES